MGNRRRVSQMLSVDDAYWGFVNKLRFYRWVYATMTLFGMFAIVVTFFNIGAGTSYAPDFLKNKPNLTVSQMNENERLLQWLYVFVPSPVLLGWFVVYFGKFFSVVKIKRLRKTRNFRYNLLWASVAAAAMYAAFIKLTLKMELNTGPKLRGAMIMALCEFGLIFLEVYDERRTRKRRHELKRVLQAHAQRSAQLEDQVRHDHRETPQQYQTVDGTSARRSVNNNYNHNERESQELQTAQERALEHQYRNPVPGGIL